MAKCLIFLSLFLSINVFSNVQYQELNSMDPDFSNIEQLISQDEIFAKISKAAKQIDEDYKGKEIVVLMIMKGSFIFVADLVREIKTPLFVEAIKASSYGEKGDKRGALTLQGLEKINLQGKHVLLVDDIFDSGNTLVKIKSELAKQNPASLKSLVLLLKNTKQRDENVALPDYYLFEIEDKFVVGYGLDYKECFRNLKGIYLVR